MTLHSDAGYGCAAGRTNVRDAVQLLGLECVTAVNVRDEAFGAIPRDNIDHICLDNRLRPLGAPIVWFDKQLSDHNGVAVEFEVGASGD